MANYLVLDFETTGLDANIEQTTEIGAIKFDTDFQEIDRYHAYISLHVEHGLSAFITKLTGITAELLAAEGVQEEEAMMHLAGMIDEDTIVVAQYAPFDFAFLANYDIHPQKFLCTKCLTNIAEPFAKSGLGVTCERNGIMLNNAHTAMGDVQATAELLQLRLKQVLGCFENFITEEPSRPLSFVPKHTASVMNTKEIRKMKTTYPSPPHNGGAGILY